jgi:hypothetical protein
MPLKSNPTTSQLSKNPTNTPENPISEELQEKGDKKEINAEEIGKTVENALLDRGEHLKKLVAVLLPLTDAHMCARVVSCIELTADGVGFLDVMDATGLKLAQINAWKRRELFRKLWYAAKDAGEECRIIKREQVAHDHAVNGTEKPVYQQGVEVGRIREFDHRLLEFLLKADNPTKYRDAGAQVSIQNNAISLIVEKHRSI